MEGWIEGLHDGEEPGEWRELMPDGEPTPAQQEAIDRLSLEERDAIDAMLLAHAPPRWGKVATLVADVMMRVHHDGIPDVFYAGRVRELVRQGEFELHGDPRRMRFSEVRLRVPTARVAT